MTAKGEHETTSVSFPHYARYGDVLGVMNAILTRQSLLNEGRKEEADTIRPLIYFEGGGHAVSREIGLVEEFFRNNFFNGAVRWAIGASAGSVVAVHGVTGNSEATKIFIENCENRFAGVRNYGRRRVHALVDFQQYHQRLRDIGINKKILQNSPTEVVVFVFNRDTSQVEPVHLNYHSHPEDVLMASCAIPYVGNISHINLDGKRYNDGGLMGIPIEELLKLYNPTHILIVRSSPYIKQLSERRRENAIALVSRHLPLPSMARTALASFERGRVSMKKALLLNSQEGVRVGVVAPIDFTSVGVLTMDPSLIEKAIQDSRDAAREFLSLVLGERGVA